MRKTDSLQRIVFKGVEIIKLLYKFSLYEMTEPNLYKLLDLLAISHASLFFFFPHARYLWEKYQLYNKRNIHIPFSKVNINWTEWKTSIQ